MNLSANVGICYEQPEYQKGFDFCNLATRIARWIVDYRNGLKDQRVVSCVTGEPGSIMDKFPDEMPVNGKLTTKLIDEFIEKMLPGICHWQHPNFHGYVPCGASYASTLGQFLACGLGTYVSLWKISPSGSELELLMMRWLAKAFDLPPSLASDGENHLATVMSSSSEAILVAMCAARDKCLSSHPGIRSDRLVAYASTICHSCVVKAARIINVQIRLVDPDSNPSTCNIKRYGIRGKDVERAVEEDVKSGLIPVFLVCTLGTTDLCSFDQLEEMKEVSDKYDIWIHVDAAYAGAAFCCPEIRSLLGSGLEYCHSLEVNPYKWLLIHHDGSCFWSNRKKEIQASMDMDSAYFRNAPSRADAVDDPAEIHDLKRFCLPTARFPRFIKFWFTFNYYGLNGLRSYIRSHIRLAKRFARYIAASRYLELIVQPTLGLVCFKMSPPFQSSDTEKLLLQINESRETYLTGTVVNGEVIIRLCICAEDISEKDIDNSWNIISRHVERYVQRSNGLLM